MRRIDEAAAETDAVKDKKMIEGILEEMQDEISGFMSAVVVNNNGIAIGATSANLNYHPESAATQLAQLMEQVNLVAGKVSLGKLENTLITGADGYLLVESLGDGSFHIGVSLGKDATPGLARVIMKDYTDRVWDVLRSVAGDSGWGAAILLPGDQRHPTDE